MYYFQTQSTSSCAFSMSCHVPPHVCLLDSRSPGSAGLLRLTLGERRGPSGRPDARLMADARPTGYPIDAEIFSDARGRWLGGHLGNFTVGTGPQPQLKRPRRNAPFPGMATPAASNGTHSHPSATQRLSLAKAILAITFPTHAVQSTEICTTKVCRALIRQVRVAFPAMIVTATAVAW